MSGLTGIFLRGYVILNLPPTKVNHNRGYRKFNLFIFADTATQVVYLKYPEGISGKANWWAAIPNKSRGAPKDKDNLKLAYQQLGMTTMNVDDKTATTLVDKTIQADDVDGHDLGDDHDRDGKHDDNDYEEIEEGEWEDEGEYTDDDNEGDMTLQSDDDDDDDVFHNG